VHGRRQIAGSVVAVTGGARGIGLATARALAAGGAQVAMGDVDGPLAVSAAREFGAFGAPLDVSSRESFAAFLGTVADRLGPLDVLINDAGMRHAAPFLEESDDSSRRQVDMNLHGVILGMKLALPGMVERGAGHVVVVASAAAKAGVPRAATHSATSHAVLGLCEAVRHELQGTGVELSVVLPGFERRPEAVAHTIAGVLARPRFAVYVPRAAALLPRRMRAKHR
jgi:NAD(P)-dependent dehydrogenase (short-subunit alcohol dehydrogenase family)